MMLPLLAGGDVNAIADVVIAMVAAFVAALIAIRLKIPTVLGFLAAGVLIGPGVSGIVHHPQSVDLMAEIGIVFLLFTIGLKFSLKELVKLRRAVFGAGSLQVGLTTAAGAGLMMLLGYGLMQALFFGILLALSSTAVVIKLMEDKGVYPTPEGKASIGVLLFQDIAAILLIVLVPVLGASAGLKPGAEEKSAGELVWEVSQAFLVIIGIFVAARLLLPRLFRVVVGTRSRELFSLATVVIVLATAAGAGAAGVSLALGAFIAGMVISESDFARQVFADILPIRDTLTGLFFVSIGMLVEPGIWTTDWDVILGLTAGGMIVKFALLTGIMLIFGYGGRISVIAGAWLCQVGEFSFVIARSGAVEGLMSARELSLLIAFAILSMALTPLVFTLGPRLFDRMTRRERMRFLRDTRTQRFNMKKLNKERGQDAEDGHVLIIGFGISGRNVARMLRHAAIPYTILEMNPRTVEVERERGERIFFGDASRSEILHMAGIRAAHVVVVALPDPATSEAVVKACHEMAPSARIAVRTRYLREVERLEALGADLVVPEEFETSLALAGGVMEALGATAWGIAQQQRAIRKEHYALLSDSEDAGAADTSCADQPELALIFHAGLASVSVPSDSPVCGTSLKSLNLRQKTGASVIAIGRGNELIRNPGGEEEVRPGDIVYLFGDQSEISRATSLLKPTPRDSHDSSAGSALAVETTQA